MPPHSGPSEAASPHIPLRRTSQLSMWSTYFFPPGLIVVLMKTLLLFLLCSLTEAGQTSYTNLNTKEITMNHPYNDKFSRMVIEERERLKMVEMECKENENKPFPSSLRRILNMV